MSNTPEEILERIQDGISNVNYCPGGHAIDKYELGLANDALYQLILTEVIGEDVTMYPRRPSMPDDIWYGLVEKYSQRAEQRQTLAKLFNKEIN